MSNDSSSEKSRLAQQLRRGKTKNISTKTRARKDKIKAVSEDKSSDDSTGSSSSCEPSDDETAAAARDSKRSSKLLAAQAAGSDGGALEGDDGDVSDEAISDAELKAMGIESFVSKRGNLCFRVSATPSRGPFMSIASCLDFMQGKYYTRVTKEMQRLLDPQAPVSTRQKKPTGRGHRSKAKQQAIDDKRKAKRKARNSVLTELEIAAKKAKFARKKARREARKAAGIGPKGKTVFEN